MFGFSSLNLARLSDKQLWPWDSFLKGLLALSLHPWKNCEEMKDVVGDMGLFSRTKLYAQGSHRRVLSNCWCLEWEIIKFLQWKNLFVLEKCIWGQKYFYFSSSAAKPLWVLCSSLKWSSCGWTGAGCFSLGRTEQTCPNWALFAVPLEEASHISSRCSALFQVLKNFEHFSALAESGFDASLRIYYTWYYMPTLHCLLQFSFSWFKGKKIVVKEWMSYIGNPEQIWTNSMSVWSCSSSVPAVVEGLVLIQKEQKWNSCAWMK